MSVIISDFLTDEDYVQAIDRLCEQRRDVLCLQILSRAEINPQVRGKMHLFDAENSSSDFRKKIDKDVINAYKEALRFVVENVKNACESRGAHYLFVPAYTSPADVFFGKLADLEVVK